MRKFTVTIKIPKKLLEIIDKAVETGLYASRSELIRSAVLLYLKQRHPELFQTRREETTYQRNLTYL